MVADIAVGVLAASADAGVAAVVVETGLASRTLIVVLTLAPLTEGVRVSLEAGRAATLGLSAPRGALRPSTTRVRVAGIRLLDTSGDSVRHGYVAGLTFAHWVPESVDLAQRVPATGAGEAGVRRRSPGLDPSTPCDCVRLGRESGQAGAHWVSLSVGIALGVGSARCRLARIWSGNTVVVLADIVSPAVSVHLTLPPAAGDCVWLGYIGRQAAADGVARARDRALCVWAAGRWVTRIRFLHATVVLANIPSSTVRINGALPLASGDGVWHWNVPGEAAADGIAEVVFSALGVRSAGRRVARIRSLDTTLALANKPGLAVRIPGALWSAACDCVRFGDQARLASTNRIPPEANCANSPRTAGRRTARIRFLNTPLALTNIPSLTIWVSEALRLAA